MNRRRLVRQGSGALLLFALLSALTGPIQAQTVSLTAYRAIFAAAGPATGSGLTPQHAALIARRLRAVHTVAYPDGQQVAVDNGALIQLLTRAAGGSVAAQKEALVRLRALDALLNVRSADAAADPRQQAAGILASEEFQRAAEANGEPTWWTAFRRRVSKAIDDFLNRLFGGHRWNPATGTGFMGSAALFVLYFLAAVGAVVAVWFLWTHRNNRQAKERRETAQGEFDGAAPDPLGVARERAAAGDYRAAMRLTYLACLRRLAGSGLLVLEENKTNWEHQHALRSRSGEAYKTLLPVTRDFDRIWYGRTPATREEYERALAAYAALPAAVKDEEP